MLPYHTDQASLFRAGDVTPSYFERHPASFTTLAAICAECSRLAYVGYLARDLAKRGDARQKLESALAAGGLGPVAAFVAHIDQFASKERDELQRTGTEAFAAVRAVSGELIIAFRGTEPDRKEDLFTDVNAVLVRWDRGGKVHNGFLQAFRAIEPAIAAWIAQHGSGPIVFTGHSLGGALATLAASRWPAGRLITFGSPRVGDAAFVNTLSATTIDRYVDCWDLVPRLPPTLPWLAVQSFKMLGRGTSPLRFWGLYQHTGGRRYIDRNGTVHEQIDDDAVNADQARATADLPLKQRLGFGRIGTRALSDHAPVNYLRALIPDAG